MRLFTNFIYIYTIQKASSQVDAYQEYLSAATRCQNQIFNIVEESSLAARYCVVLEELRREAMEQIERSQGLRATALDSSMASLGEGCVEIARHPNGDEEIRHPATFGNLSGTNNNFDLNTNLGSFADFSNWVQFESMVRPTSSLV